MCGLWSSSWSAPGAKGAGGGGFSVFIALFFFLKKLYFYFCYFCFVCFCIVFQGDTGVWLEIKELGQVASFSLRHVPFGAIWVHAFEPQPLGRNDPLPRKWDTCPHSSAGKGEQSSQGSDWMTFCRFSNRPCVHHPFSGSVSYLETNQATEKTHPRKACRPGLVRSNRATRGQVVKRMGYAEARGGTPEAEPLVDFHRGASPFSGWIQTTFGGTSPLTMGRVYQSWVNCLADAHMGLA